MYIYIYVYVYLKKSVIRQSVVIKENEYSMGYIYVYILDSKDIET